MAYPNLRDEILSYVYSYSEEHGYAPSYREICQALGVKSKSTVQNHIRRLEAEGRLCFRTKRPRTMVERRQASVTVSDTQRLRLKIADGGEVLVDCDVTGAGSGGVRVSFSGVLDATGLRCRVGRVVSCSIDAG